MLIESGPGQAHAAVWTADASATVELSRLSAPAHGHIDPPRHLLVAGPVNLDDMASKVGLYRACLLLGGPYDMYQWINLAELVRVWPLLDLPPGIAACWTRALRDAGLLPAPPPPAIPVRRGIGSATPTGRTSPGSTGRIPPAPTGRTPVLVAGQTSPSGSRPRIPSPRAGKRRKRPA